ncbi:MAG: hypothetical protein NT002_09090 [candidate division Zixibacteria bacterium]|nr:hypothetical protein [candidate division Zixibacteria bacterium]
MNEEQDQKSNNSRLKSLEIEKLLLENKKLQLEGAELARPWWRKPSYIAALAPLILAIIGLLSLWFAGFFNEERQNLKEQIGRIKTEIQPLQAKRDSLVRQIALNDSVLRVKDIKSEEDARTIADLNHKIDSLINEKSLRPDDSRQLDSQALVYQSNIEAIKEERPVIWAVRSEISSLPPAFRGQIRGLNFGNEMGTVIISISLLQVDTSANGEIITVSSRGPHLLTNMRLHSESIIVWSDTGISIMLRGQDRQMLADAPELPINIVNARMYCKITVETSKGVASNEYIFESLP